MSLKALRQDLRLAADPKIAAHSAGFFKTGPGDYGEGDVFLGIRIPFIRQTVKKYLPLPYENLLSLLKSKYHEERLAALIGLVYLYAKADEIACCEIYNHYLENTAYINNWDLVDSSAHQIVGGYLLDKDKAPLYRLVKSDSLWERRIAIIATFHFIKCGHLEDTLELSEMLLLDQEDLMHKAVGWMLREVGKREQALEERFLKKHYQQMPRTMLRYAIEKFPETLRQDYLKGRI